MPSSGQGHFPFPIRPRQFVPTPRVSDMAQFYTEDEAAEKVSLPVDEFKRGLPR